MMPAVNDIAFVRYAIPDLDRMAQFLADFGLHTVHKDAPKSRAISTRSAAD